MTVIADVFDRTDDLVTTYVTGGYEAAASWAAPAIYAGFTLYVIVMGLAYLRTSWNLTFVDISMRMMKGALIVVFATQWGWFSTVVYNGLAGLNEQLGTALMVALGVPRVGANVLESAALMLINGANGQVSRIVGFPPDLGALVSMIVLYVGLFLLIGYSVFVLIFAKIAFAIVIVLAPIFVPTYLFDATRDVFGAWVRTVLAFVAIPVLATAVLAFAFSVLGNSLTQAGTGNINLTDAAITGLMCVVFALIMWQVPTIASGMVGSVGSSGAGAMAKMFMTPIARGVTGAALVSRHLRSRAAQRWGAEVERGRQRELARVRARQRSS